MYQPLGNLRLSQRLGSFEGSSRIDGYFAGLGGMFGRRRGRGLERKIENQERKLERMQQRMAQMQNDPNKAAQLQRLQDRLAKKTSRLELMRQRFAPASVVSPVASAAAAIDPKLATPPGWNEAAYLAKNPDVAEAVRLGRMRSGHWHYENYGKKEGRALAGLADLASNKTVLLVAGLAVLWWWKNR